MTSTPPEPADSPVDDAAHVDRVPSRRTAWRRLRNILRPRHRLSQYVVGTLCALLGLSLVMQVQRTDQDEYGGLSQQELLRMLDESDRQTEQLQQEGRDLDRSLQDLRQGRADSEAARQAAEDQLTTLRILAGTAPAVGRGVVIQVSAPPGTLRAPTLLGIIQELRNAGAEVIQIDDVRVVASTAVTTGPDGTLLVDGQPLDSSVEIRAIGDPAVMEPALKIPGGAADDTTADGATLTVRRADEVTVDAVVDPPEPTYANEVK
ncbi:DUF881 domain-containing protein [Brachybacterium sp. EF45031]|uniref:DUF881 domain-containing protein n=1 Tax=Brachybacterium sillae TaxID=2810536 RepID=UPI00217D8B00|nr:DUF881 domain-containing protein [Brachybacterium sillae]MCS6710621.1 DUF881 domain-containing protein [Brachybacterium sillae]